MGCREAVGGRGKRGIWDFECKIFFFVGEIRYVTRKVALKDATLKKTRNWRSSHVSQFELPAGWPSLLFFFLKPGYFLNLITSLKTFLVV